MIAIPTLLSQAMEKHQNGDMVSARLLYERIIALNPSDADALNLLGVLALQHGQLNEAYRFIKNAIDINPHVAEYHHNLGQVFKQRGDQNQADICFRQSLTLDPNLQIAKDHLEKGLPKQSNASGLTRFQTEMKRHEVIQQVVNKINGRLYLEIGIYSGKLFSQIRINRKIGIDPSPTKKLIDQLLAYFDIQYFSFSTSGPKNISELTLKANTSQTLEQLPPGEEAELYFMTSDQFFEQKAPALFEKIKIDVVFIDGLHTHDQAYQDVQNVLPYLNEQGVILLHDCNPPTASAAFPAPSFQDAIRMNLPNWTGLWCGDVWKSIVQLRSTFTDLNVFVLNCDFGIGVIARGKPQKMLCLYHSRL